MEATGPMAYDATDYAVMVRRHWWLVVLAVAVALAATLGVLRLVGREYVSSTAVLVHPVHGQDVNVAGGRTTGEINLDTEAQLVRSTAVAADAATQLHTTVPVGRLIAQVSVTVPANTAVMNIRFTARTPQAAQAGSHAFAEAYLSNREASGKAAISAEVGALATKVSQLGTQLAQVDVALVHAPPGSAARSNQQAVHNTVASQINALTSRLNALSTTTTQAGKIISDAALPTGPSQPDVPLYLGSGGLLGLVLGVGLAGVRQRVDRRVRHVRDVARANLPVLAELLPRTRLRLADLSQPGSAGGRACNRLRNEVVAALRPADRVILVAGASPGPAGAVVAAHLAAALARAGSEVILVATTMSTVDNDGRAGATAGGAEDAELDRAFAVDATPGLLDVLTGAASLPDAVRDVPWISGLRVIPSGQAANAAGVLRFDTIRDLLGELGAGYDFVVVAAPSLANGAEAQSLATIADAVLLVVELDRSRRDEVSDARQQLHRVGATLLGAVVLPNLRSRRSAARRSAGDATGPIAGARPPDGSDRLVAPAGERSPGRGYLADQQTGTGEDTAVLPQVARRRSGSRSARR